MRLSTRLLSIPVTVSDGDRRSLATYDGKHVLLEWKNLDSAGSVPIELRVNEIAALLHELNPSFHSLPCLGYVADQSRNRFGYIFSIPQEWPQQIGHGSGKRASVTPAAVSTLRQSLETGSPSLNQRLEIAKTVLETLLGLHTAGWLHKSLISDNVLVPHLNKHETADQQDGQSCHVYVLGYVFSRADRPGEMTEPLSSQAESALYQHPQGLATENSFRKIFDIFSVGMLLLEIGLWAPLSTILRRHDRRPARFKDIARVDSGLSGITLLEDRPRLRSEHKPDLLELRQHLLASLGARDQQKGCEWNESDPIIRALASAAGKRTLGLSKTCSLQNRI